MCVRSFKLVKSGNLGLILNKIIFNLRYRNVMNVDLKYSCEIDVVMKSHANEKIIQRMMNINDEDIHSEPQTE